MPAQPRSPYALQKYAGEVYCRLYAELYGLETVALRYFNVYGPRQDPNSEYAAVIPRFVTRVPARACRRASTATGADARLHVRDRRGAREPARGRCAARVRQRVQRGGRARARA